MRNKNTSTKSSNARSLKIYIIFLMSAFIFIFIISISSEYGGVFSAKVDPIIGYSTIAASCVVLGDLIIDFIKLLCKQKEILKYISITPSKQDRLSFDKQEYLEGEILKLSERLVASEDKWKSMYQLMLSSQKKQLNNCNAISQSDSLNESEMNNSIAINDYTAFISMPFSSNYIETFLRISNVCEKLKIKVIRSDEKALQANMEINVVEHIVESSVVISVIDGRNVNVFYELGIAHALNKPTILVSKVDFPVPFDIQDQYDVTLYSSLDELEKRLNDLLLKMLPNNN